MFSSENNYYLSLKKCRFLKKSCIIFAYQLPTVKASYEITLKNVIKKIKKKKLCFYSYFINSKTI